ncbi:MAG: Eco47II family restriction endonuclease [Candidatus Liberibacter solanacearum]|uniref:Eco47II family restriction endonuclease n=1 Tax=Candidatus Liberibacter solanacearum TaxID=556287 RepID=UPI0009D78A7F|nr:Eco47II family restriction endonuclease [Candidatus Liberibacter solanacearum]
MVNYDLGFISDDDLYLHVADTINNYKVDMDWNVFIKNVVDPIKLSFDSIVYNKNISDLISNEILRQLDRANTNTIGYFHQNLFLYINNKDWEVPENGFDLINKSKSIFCKIKNKFNTMNSSSANHLYVKMLNLI